MLVKHCEGCDGSGIRSPAEPMCRIAMRPGWLVVERCDTCERFRTDLDAAKSRYHDARWVTCANGGDHAIARRTN